MTPAPTIGTGHVDADFLDSLRWVGDPVADDVAAAFLHSADGDAQDLLKRMIDRGAHSDEEIVILKEFVAHRPPLPDWARDDLISLGQETFASWAGQAMLSLFTAVLPASYAAGDGADLLAATGRLVSDARRRYLETGQFVMDVMAPDGLDDARPGSRDIRHVRLMHAVVRHLHGTHARQLGLDEAPAGMGLPANQEDMLGLTLVLGLECIDALRRLGCGLSEDEEEAMLHTWCVVGSLLGVRDDLLPLDMADARVVWGQIRERTYRRSDGGAELAAAAVDTLNDLIPLPFTSGYPATTMRFHLTDEVGDMLELDPSNWTRVLLLPQMFFDRITSRFLGRSRVAHAVSGFTGRWMVNALLDLERGGEQRPSFSVPDELADQLRPPKVRRLTRRR